MKTSSNPRWQMGDREGEIIKRAGKGSSRDNWRHLRPPPFAPTRRRAWQHKQLVTGTGVGGGEEGFRSNKYVYRGKAKRRHPLHPRGSTRSTHQELEAPPRSQILFRPPTRLLHESEKLSSYSYNPKLAGLGLDLRPQ